MSKKRKQHPLGGIDLTRGIYRKIYSGFISGRRICAVSMEAEAFFWRLHQAVDDFGNAPSDPIPLRNLTAGRRDEITPQRISIWIEELSRVGLIGIYDHQGDYYLHIFGWRDRQPAPNGEERRRARRYPPSFWEDRQAVGYAGVDRGEQGDSGGHQDQDQDQNKNQYQSPRALGRVGQFLGAAAEVDADSTPPAVPPVPGPVPASETSGDAASPPPTGAARSTAPRPPSSAPDSVAPADPLKFEVFYVFRDHPHPAAATMNPMDRDVFVQIAREHGLELMRAVLDETLGANEGGGARKPGKYALGALEGVRARLAAKSRAGPSAQPGKRTNSLTNRALQRALEVTQ